MRHDWWFWTKSCRPCAHTPVRQARARFTPKPRVFPPKETCSFSHTFITRSFWHGFERWLSQRSQKVVRGAQIGPGAKTKTWHIIIMFHTSLYNSDVCSFFACKCTPPKSCRFLAVEIELHFTAVIRHLFWFFHNCSNFLPTIKVSSVDLHCTCVWVKSRSHDWAVFGFVIKNCDEQFYKMIERSCHLFWHVCTLRLFIFGFFVCNLQFMCALGGVFICQPSILVFAFADAKRTPKFNWVERAACLCCFCLNIKRIVQLIQSRNCTQRAAADLESHCRSPCCIIIMGTSKTVGFHIHHHCASWFCWFCYQDQGFALKNHTKLIGLVAHELHFRLVMLIMSFGQITNKTNTHTHNNCASMVIINSLLFRKWHRREKYSVCCRCRPTLLSKVNESPCEWLINFWQDFIHLFICLFLRTNWPLLRAVGREI